MEYLEGYRGWMRYFDDFGFCRMRPVENVFLPEWEGVDKSIRPMVDSSPSSLYRTFWEFDSSWTREKLDRALALVVE